MSGRTGGKRRRFQGVKGMRPDTKELRRNEAKERTEAWQKLSVKEQIAVLDKRLGEGKGAAKQRARLALAGLPKPEAEKPKEEAVPVTPVEAKPVKKYMKNSAK